MQEVLDGLALDRTNRIAALRWHAGLAAAYDEAIRLDQRLSAGFGRLRRKHLQRVAALVMQELTADARLRGEASAGC